MRRLLGQKPDLPLAQLRTAVGLECTLPAIHYVLVKMGLSYKKRPCAPAQQERPASAAALASVTPKDALHWFASCGYSFI